MSFLQPLLLAALPLISLPIIIHLINQRRYQTRRWGAMMFLLAANRMSRGYARLRQWLILLFRTLAVAGLIFAVARPLAGGWMGSLLGGRPDTTIILLDRSPSMQQIGAGVVLSKLDSGRRQLAATLETLGSTRWVLIDSQNLTPRELATPAALLDSPDLGPSSASADLPAMLESASAYIAANQTGRTEVWICSDLHENDWNADSGRWSALRDKFLQFTQGVRFHLLAYPQPAPNNASVRITDVRQQASGERLELLVSLEIIRDGPAEGSLQLPLQFEIEGARSVLDVEFSGPRFELQSHRIELPAKRTRGWGKVSIPADANPADNQFFFTFDQPAARHTIVVAEDPQAARPMELAAAISPDPNIPCTAETVSRSQLAAIAWESTALVLWQAQLPDAAETKLLDAFVERGGQVVFFPPRNPNDAEQFGVRWLQWRDAAKQDDAAHSTVASWRGDQGLLANTLSGASLPVGQLKVHEYCSLSGELTPLATLADGAPLLGRVATDRGGVYFCATTPAPSDSSLAKDGVVFYGMTHRALAAGAAVLGSTRQLIAGPPPAELPADWKQLDGPLDALSTDYPFHAGVYSTEEQLLAVNRPLEEGTTQVLSDERVRELFAGLDLVRVNDQAGRLDALVQEIWRVFLAAMMIAMIVEACLCMPHRRVAEGAAR